MARKRIPALPAARLKLVLQRLDALPIPDAAKQAARASLIAASNPDAERIDVVMRTLERQHRANITATAQSVAQVFSTPLSRARAAALALPPETWQLPADERARKAAIDRIVKLLVALYLLLPEDIDALTAELMNARGRAWTQRINELITRYAPGAGSARAARGADYAALARESQTDATGIALTWQRDVERKAYDILAGMATVAGIAEVLGQLEDWVNERRQRKAAQIGMQTEQSTRFRADTRFYDQNKMNGPEARFRFAGPPAVCKECVRCFGLGVVGWDVVTANPCPRHPNCPHWWERLGTFEIVPETAWIG